MGLWTHAGLWASGPPAGARFGPCRWSRPPGPVRRLLCGVVWLTRPEGGGGEVARVFYPRRPSPPLWAPGGGWDDPRPVGSAPPVRCSPLGVVGRSRLRRGGGGWRLPARLKAGPSGDCPRRASPCSTSAPRIDVVWSCSPGPSRNRAGRGTGVPGERVRSSRSVRGAPRLSSPPLPVREGEEGRGWVWPLALIFGLPSPASGRPWGPLVF